MRVVLRPIVESDLEEASSWYAEKQPGLDQRFLAEVRAAIGMIGENPRLYQFVHLDIRRAPLRRFPYGVFYIEIGSVVHVIGVVQDARHPSFWRRRRR